MKLYVSHVYWVLLFTSVVSSALLFLIVASENIHNNKIIGPDRNKVLSQERNNFIIEDFNDQSEADVQGNSYVRISSTFKSKVPQNFEDVQAPISVSFDSSNKNDENVLGDIEILKESLAQPSNFSQGISDGEQAVVLTLVKTASSLHSLSEAREELYSNSISIESNVSIGLSRDDENREQNSVDITPVLDGDDNLTNEIQESEFYQTDEDNVVVIVRAEQKSTSSINIELKLEEEDEKDYNRVEKSRHEEVEEDLSSPQMQKSQTTAPDLNDSVARARLTGNVDDSAAVILNSFVITGSSDTHEEIPSFNEWAQKRLEEVEKKKVHPNASVQTANGSPGRGLGSMRMRSKNYASPDCGAKIVAANPESRSTRSILVSTRDEYMLNTCTTRVWFIVELCEAIQAKKIELANFELFSSSPKDLSVYVSDRFPTRDWSIVGQFTARDERDVQNFSLQPHLFGKFIKVELHSHYGSEHFCPISLFRAYGTSEFEVLETETESDSIETDQRHESNIGGKADSGFDMENEDDDDKEIVFDDDDNRNDRSGGHIFGSARDAVISIVKKAAEVLVKNDDLKAINNITYIQENENDDEFNDLTLNCVTPIYNIVCHDCNDDHFSRIFQLISCKGYHLESLLNVNFIKQILNSSRVCNNTSEFTSTYVNEPCIHNCKVFNKRRINILKHEIQAQFLKSFFSHNYLVALCNILAAKENKLFINTTHHGYQLSNSILNDTHIEQSSQILATKEERFVSTRPIDVIPILDKDKTKVEVSVIKSKVDLATESQKIENLATWIKPTKTTVMNDEAKKKSFVPNIESSRNQQSQNYEVYQVDSSLTTESSISVITKRTSIYSQKTVSGAVSQEHVQDKEANSQDVPVLDTVLKFSQNLDSTQNLNQNTVNVVYGEVETESEEEIESKTKTDSIEQDSKTIAQDQLNFEGFDFKDLDVENLPIIGGMKNDASITQQTVSATTPQQKESVFLRLSNRIKALERNMSLSSQYLEELSRRYKKQVEEMQRSLERAVTTMNEETRKGEERENKRVEEVTTLRNQIANLGKILDLLVHEHNSWHISFLSLMQHTLFVLIDVVLVILILSYCRRADDDFNCLKERNDQINFSKRPRGTNYEIVKQHCTQMTKRPKKRRPSEIASQVSGTYDQLMIEDSLLMNQLPRRDKRKKRKKDSIILRSSSIKETNSIGMGGGDSENVITRISILPSRSSSANDALYLLNHNNDVTYPIKVSQKQDRFGSAPDNSIDYFSDISKQQLQYDQKIQILSMEENHDKSINSNENKAIDMDVLNTPKTLLNDAFEQVESITRNINVKAKKLSSSSFIKTALASRSKRLSFSGSIKKKQLQCLENNLDKSNGKLDLLPELENSNGLGHNNEYSNGCTTNGHIEESDESRSSSATPTMNWYKKEKKSNGLKKMVRKFF